SYTGPTVGNVFLARMRYIWHVTLYDILTGEDAGSKTFKGSMPDECPPKANFLVGSTISKSFGKRPTADDIVAWLNELNVAK
ncbi:MAG: hypothetical protein MUO77_10535, partial [Anaerolineales bacterium]|nr:hypothetical protein [Anaerolineales bacterium]